jgi:fructokinase
MAGPSAMPIVVCWGELLWDLFPDGPRFGGALANVAYHTAKLGAHAVLVSRVGDDVLGEQARAALARAGVDVSHVQVDRERATGTVRVEIQSGEPRYTIASEAAWDRIQLTPELGELLPSADALCFGTLAQRTPLANEELERAVASMRSDSVRLCDLNLRPPHVNPEVVLRSLACATCVKLNEQELARVGEATATDDPVARMFESPRLTHVAVTLGRRGAELWTRADRFSRPATPIDEAKGDRVGAGDAFVAALTLGLIQRLSPDATLSRATHYAAFVAERAGGMPAVPDSLLRSLDEIGV